MKLSTILSYEDDEDYEDEFSFEAVAGAMFYR